MRVADVVLQRLPQPLLDFRLDGIRQIHGGPLGRIWIGRLQRRPTFADALQGIAARRGFVDRQRRLWSGGVADQSQGPSDVAELCEFCRDLVPIAFRHHDVVVAVGGPPRGIGLPEGLGLFDLLQQGVDGTFPFGGQFVGFQQQRGAAVLGGKIMGCQLADRVPDRRNLLKRHAFLEHDGFGRGPFVVVFVG